MANKLPTAADATAAVAAAVAGAAALKHYL